jgi:hypothetical protein
MEAPASLKRPIREIRRANLERLIAEFDNSRTALSKQVETTDTLLSAIRTGNRELGDRLATRLEEKAGKPFGWMDCANDEPVAVEG